MQAYSCISYYPDYPEMSITNDFALMIDFKLFCDILHTEIRRVLILYVGRRKREQQIEENKLYKEVEILTQEKILDS